MKGQFLWIIKRIFSIYASKLSNSMFSKGATLNLENLMILDIGSGRSDSKDDTNDLTKELLRNGYAVHGIDLKNVSYAHPNYFFVQGSFLENKYSSESFDIVISCATWHHVGKIYRNSVPSEKVQKEEDPLAPTKFLKEVSRILKDKGDFFLTLDVIPSPERKDTWRWSEKDADALLSNYFETIESSHFPDGGYTCYCLHLRKKEKIKES